MPVLVRTSISLSVLRGSLSATYVSCRPREKRPVSREMNDRYLSKTCVMRCAEASRAVTLARRSSSGRGTWPTKLMYRLSYRPWRASAAMRSMLASLSETK